MKRNLTLDIFKLFLCILVIIIHMPSLLEDYKAFSWIFTYGITRIAVPIFFIIGGYYLGSKLENFSAFKKYLIHLSVIYVTWFVLYLPIDFWNLQIDGRYDLYKTINSILFGFSHLWYVPALILGSIILYLAKRIIKNDKAIFVIAIITLIGATIYALSIDPYQIPIKTYRNGLFFGFPFIAIGYYIYKADLINKAKGYYLIPIAIITTFTLILEAYGTYTTKTFPEILFSLIILCPTLFIIASKYSYYANYSLYLAQLSGAVYFVHRYVVVEIIPVQENSLYKLPEVFIISVLLSFIIIFVNKRIKIFL